MNVLCYGEFSQASMADNRAHGLKNVYVETVAIVGACQLNGKIFEYYTFSVHSLVGDESWLSPNSPIYLCLFLEGGIWRERFHPRPI